jgi:hypothetical protein
MKRYVWVITIGAILLACSTLMYLLDYLTFHNARDMAFYLVGDIAFLPIEVFLVVIVIEGLLTSREKRAMLRKMNMPIGLFFSELGVGLLGKMTGCISNKEGLRPYLAINNTWAPRDYARAHAFVSAFECRLDPSGLDLPGLRDALVGRRNLLLMLLANPNLLEHEEFTDLLWAIFHLMEELSARQSFDDLPQTDLEHLAGDALRVYSQLTNAWLRYCEHLQTAYPYMFSILARTHPLQDHPDATVR